MSDLEPNNDNALDSPIEVAEPDQLRESEPALATS
jgi:hypothetical protein